MRRGNRAAQAAPAARRAPGNAGLQARHSSHAITGIANFNPRFPGQWQDAAAGYAYNYLRDYDATLGRYIQPDPLGPFGGRNRFAYAEGNPVNLTDPTGESVLPYLPVACALGNGFYFAFLDYLQQRREQAAAGCHAQPFDYWRALAAFLEGAFGGWTFCLDLRGAFQLALAARASIRLPILVRGRRPGPSNPVNVNLSQGSPPRPPRGGDPVKPYEVGQYGDLARRSKGDALDVHHAGQKAAFKEIVPGYKPSTGPSIVLPTKEHRDIPTAIGPFTKSPRDQLAKDIRDLRVFTKAPNSSLRELINLNKSMFPGAFRK